MSNPSKKYSFSDFFAEGQFKTQTETLEQKGKKGSISIGIPKEHTLSETRVALVPNNIRTLIGYGHEIKVETGAGIKSNFTDHDFSEAGAKIAHSQKEIFECDVVVKVTPPDFEEIDLMKSNQILITPLHIPTITKEKIEKLKEKRIIAIAMEYFQSKDGTFPIVRIMSEIAGMSAMLTAAELLSYSEKGRGILLGGVSGVPPAKVIILGAGVVGEFATRTALGLGASVRVFDSEISKLMRFQSNIGRQLHTSSFNPVYLGYQLMSADVVIGAIHSKTGSSPVLVTEDMVAKMKQGSVIIDVSIDQGGCIETSRMTTHDKPTYVKHDVIHYCVPNIASKVPRTASVAISNILTSLLVQTGDAASVESLLFDNTGIRNGVYVYKGVCTNEYLCKKFDIKHTSLDLLLTSNF